MATMDGKVLEFLMDISEMEPYIGANMYHEICQALSRGDEKDIMNVIKSLSLLIAKLRGEIESKEEQIKQIENQRQEIRKSWKMCADENKELKLELRSIYASSFGDYFKARNLYKNGCSLSEIAKRLGINRTTVRNHLTTLGVKIRDDKGGRPKSQVKGGSKDSSVDSSVDSSKDSSKKSGLEELCADADAILSGTE